MQTHPKPGQQAVYVRLSTSAIILPVFCLALAGRAAGEQPTITVTRPAAGEVWYVGTTRRIEWTVVQVTDGMIYYSTNGGSDWQMVAATVLSTEPEWLRYPWTIPDDPSTECLVRVADYMWTVNDVSETFTISAVTDTDADGMDDGWEVAHFGNLSHDGMADTDSDGLTDYEEFVNGNDPLLAENPVIALDTTSLLFLAVEGGTDPADKTVNAANSGAETLREVTTSISYQSGAGWLTVTGSGPGETQTLTNSIDISGLPAGVYWATVTVAGGGAFNSEEYTVTLTIAANQAPSVDAGSDRTVELGVSALLAGFAEDDGLPYGTLTVTWSLVSGPGDASFSDANGLTTNVTFTEIGVYWIRLTASDGDLEAYDQLSVTVTEPAPRANGVGCATGGSASPGLASMFVAFLAGCTCLLRDCPRGAGSGRRSSSRPSCDPFRASLRPSLLRSAPARP